jgi:hypothetical protein
MSRSGMRSPHGHAVRVRCRGRKCGSGGVSVVSAGRTPRPSKGGGGQALRGVVALHRLDLEQPGEGRLTLIVELREGGSGAPSKAAGRLNSPWHAPSSQSRLHQDGQLATTTRTARRWSRFWRGRSSKMVPRGASSALFKNQPRCPARPAPWFWLTKSMGSTVTQQVRSERALPTRAVGAASAR